MSKRIDAIDFWRGAVLAIIFVNHIPGNVLGNVTPRNYGFSDAAEAFVFLSGLSVAFAYGDRFRTGSALEASWPLALRAMRLYAVHIALTISALALFGAAAFLTGQNALLEEHGRSTFFTDPLRGALGVVILGHQIGYFNILPLYVALLVFAPFLFAPFLFVVGRRGRWRMLLVSATLYALARWIGFNLPSWPDPGNWFFNPLTWQLMFACGIFVGLSMQQGGLPVHNGAYVLASAFTIASAVAVTDFLGLAPGLMERLGKYLDCGKTDLGVLRIIDFTALAYVIYCSRLSARLKSTPAYSALCLLGRNALTIFCLGSLLSAVGQILNATWISSPLLDVAFVAAGLWILHKIASVLECKRRAATPIANPTAAALLRSPDGLSYGS